MLFFCHIVKLLELSKGWSFWLPSAILLYFGLRIINSVLLWFNLNVLTLTQILISFQFLWDIKTVFFRQYSCINPVFSTNSTYMIIRQNLVALQHPGTYLLKGIFLFCSLECLFFIFHMMELMWQCTACILAGYYLFCHLLEL